NFVVTCNASVDGLPNWSSQTLPLKPSLSTTSVSSSHFAVEYPCQVGAQSGWDTNRRPSMNACHQRLKASWMKKTTLGVCTICHGAGARSTFGTPCGRD